MTNNKKDKRNRANKAIIFVVFLIILSSFCVSVAFGADVDDIEISADIGFNKFYEYDSQVPIKVKIKNNLRDIEGKLQVLLPYNYQNKEVYIAYSTGFSIAKDSTKEVEFVSMIASNVKKITVRLVDNNERTIEEKEISLSRGRASNDISIGVLSDDFESLNYFNLVFMTQSKDIVDNFNTNVVKINEQMVDNGEALRSFDIIIINNYNTEVLSNEERKALEEWVNAGGLLLIGTGPNYEKTLKGLGDLSYIEVTGLDDIQGIKENTIDPLTIIESTNKSGSQILVEDNKGVVYNKPTGLGNITITAFDLGLNPFLKWEGKESFLRSILGPHVTASTDMEMKYGPSFSPSPISYYRGNNYSNMLEYIPMDKAVPLKLIVWLVVSFILLVGPINYIVLKKIDKRELAWITIPGLVVVFSIFIYIWGFATRLDKPLSNNISTIMINPEDNKSVVNTTAAVLGFNSGDVDISVEGDVSFSTYGFSPEREVYKFNDGDIILEYLQNDTKHVIFKKRSVWDTQFVDIQNDISVGQGIVHDLRLEGGSIVGEVRNLTGIDIEDAVLMWNDNFVKLGDISGDESKLINLALNQTAQLNKGYHYSIEKIYPYSNTNLEYNDILNDNVKREILFGYFNSLEVDPYSDFSSGLLLIGWNRESLSENVVVNDVNTDRMDRNLVVAPLSISFPKGERIEVSHGIFNSRVIEIKDLYHGRDNSFHGVGTVTFSIKPGVEMEVEEMKINITRDIIQNELEILLYNYETNMWEDYSQETLIINGMDSKYYNSLEGTKIKVELKGKASLQSPSFSVKGVVK